MGTCAPDGSRLPGARLPRPVRARARFHRRGQVAFRTWRAGGGNRSPADIGAAHLALIDLASAEALREVEPVSTAPARCASRPYVVDDVIGRGGMAVVYRVRHSKLGTWHALKIWLDATRSRAPISVKDARRPGTEHPNVVP
jgi:hypothetical protein